MFTTRSPYHKLYIHIAIVYKYIKNILLFIIINHYIFNIIRIFIINNIIYGSILTIIILTELFMIYTYEYYKIMNNLLKYKLLSDDEYPNINSYDLLLRFEPVHH